MIVLKIKQIALEVIRSFLAVIIPVKKGKIMFQSTPDYSDNARAFSDFLLQNTDYHLYWSVFRAEKYENTERITFIERDGGRSFLGRLLFIYHTVSSEYLFSTHLAFLYANRKHQKYICLWHGAPLKKIAILQNPTNKYYLNNTSGILCTSKYYVTIMARCFGWNEERILPLGIPRNDWLFQEANALENLGVKVGDTEKIIVYLPTFRKTGANTSSDSKLELFSSGMFNFNSQTAIQELNVFMKKLNIHLIVKPHPADANQLDYKAWSNITIIPQIVFSEKDVQLNQLLHYCDALITDFSGVYIDFLNLDRPIGFLLTDLDEYTTNRGFLFDNPLNYMPGEKLYSVEDLKSFCKDISVGTDKSKAERNRLKSIYNDYADGNNCYRLAEYLGLL